MNIKKILIGLTLSMFLGSGAAFGADWGDVYYCNMTHFEYISLDGEQKGRYKLETFQFKLDKSKNAMVFGNKGYFTDMVIYLEERADSTFGIDEWWLSDDLHSIYFREGDLVFTDVGPSGLKAMSANCDKF